jgi:hypothetical protein
MSTISHKQYCTLFEKYFKCKSGISIYNNSSFNIELIEAVKKSYIDLNQRYTNQGDNEFITKEKISLKAMLNELNKEPNTFIYNPILITSCLSVLTFGVGIMYQSFSTYITKMIDYNIKSTTDNVNNTLEKVFNIIENMISNSVTRIMVYLGIALILIIIGEYIIKKYQANKIVFYKLCYDVLCEIEEGHLK